MKPVCYDLFCGLGGWSEGFLPEGYRCIGFDIEAHDYGQGGYPGELVIRDVRSIHGSQLADAAVIVASPPCQFFSYCAMPWSRAKALAKKVAADPALREHELELFKACFRIQREASEAAGRYIPLVVENVRGAQPWVGRAAWNYGSYYLWGDVPALMPVTLKLSKRPGRNFHAIEQGLSSPSFNGGEHETRHVKLPSSPGINQRDWLKSVGDNSGSRWCDREGGVKGFTPNGEPLGKNTLGRRFGSKSKARKAASAMIAKIPFVLSNWIARCYRPKMEGMERMEGI